MPANALFLLDLWLIFEGGFCLSFWPVWLAPILGIIMPFPQNGFLISIDHCYRYCLWKDMNTKAPPTSTTPPLVVIFELPKDFQSDQMQKFSHALADLFILYPSIKVGLKWIDTRNDAHQIPVGPSGIAVCFKKASIDNFTGGLLAFLGKRFCLGKPAPEFISGTSQSTSAACAAKQRAFNRIQRLRKKTIAHAYGEG